MEKNIVSITGKVEMESEMKLFGVVVRSGAQIERENSCLATRKRVRHFLAFIVLLLSTLATCDECEYVCTSMRKI